MKAKTTVYEIHDEHTNFDSWASEHRSDGVVIGRFVSQQPADFAQMAETIDAPIVNPKVLDMPTSASPAGETTSSKTSWIGRFRRGRLSNGSATDVKHAQGSDHIAPSSNETSDSEKEQTGVSPSKEERPNVADVLEFDKRSNQAGRTIDGFHSGWYRLVLKVEDRPLFPARMDISWSLLKCMRASRSMELTVSSKTEAAFGDVVLRGDKALDVSVFSVDFEVETEIAAQSLRLNVDVSVLTSHSSCRVLCEVHKLQRDEKPSTADAVEDVVVHLHSNRHAYALVSVGVGYFLFNLIVYILTMPIYLSVYTYDAFPWMVPWICLPMTSSLCEIETTYHTSSSLVSSSSIPTHIFDSLSFSTFITVGSCLFWFAVAWLLSNKGDISQMSDRVIILLGIIKTDLRVVGKVKQFRKILKEGSGKGVIGKIMTLRRAIRSVKDAPPPK